MSLLLGVTSLGWDALVPPGLTLSFLKIEKDKKQPRKHRVSQLLLQGGISREHRDCNETSLTGCKGFVRAERNSPVKTPRTSLCFQRLRPRSPAAAPRAEVLRSTRARLENQDGEVQPEQPRERGAGGRQWVRLRVV